MTNDGDNADIIVWKVRYLTPVLQTICEKPYSFVPLGRVSFCLYWLIKALSQSWLVQRLKTSNPVRVDCVPDKRSGVILVWQYGQTIDYLASDKVDSPPPTKCTFIER